MELNKIYNMDCLDGAKLIPDKSVDLILTDPPYNIGIAKWDKIKNYVEWCGLWIKECERVLKDNGSFYFWHNDMVQIAQLIEWIRLNTSFKFNSFIIWDKGNFRPLSWKNPSDSSNLKTWFNTCEYCLFYTFQDKTGLSNVMLDVNNFIKLRSYFRDLKKYTKYSKKQIVKKVGQSLDHCFRCDSPQWSMPTKEAYDKLIKTYKIDEWVYFRKYEDLRNEYENLLKEYESLKFVHNLDKNHNNVWKTNERNNGKKHLCRKPEKLINRIIKASSNEEDVVLDLFIGSGTTAVSCIENNRNFIGFEIDKNYYDIAIKEIEINKNNLFNLKSN